MMNKYIRIVASDKNEFRTTMDIEIDGQKYSSVNVKIDSGCPQTTILTSKLGISEATARKLKATDSNDPNIKKTISFGVNDSIQYRNETRQKFNNGQLLDLPAVSFRKEVSNISISGVDIGSRKIKINYDRSGNILIGVDILKTLDIHIGKENSGKTVLLACPQNSINREYLNALENLIEESTNISVTIIQWG